MLKRYSALKVQHLEEIFKKERLNICLLADNGKSSFLRKENGAKDFIAPYGNDFIEILV